MGLIGFNCCGSLVVSGTVEALLAAGDIWVARGGKDSRSGGYVRPSCRPYSTFKVSWERFGCCSKSRDRFSSSLCAEKVKQSILETATAYL